MKIIHIHFSIINGGSENLMVDIANQQVFLGHEVVIIIINRSISSCLLDRISKSIRVFFINRPPKSLNILYFFKLIFFFIKLNSFDVIHSHSIDLGFILKVFVKYLKVITVHGMDLKADKLKYYDRIFAISKSVKADIEKRTGLKATLIYNGVNHYEILQRNNNFNDIVRIVQVGRLDHRVKGQDLTILALDKIVKLKLINKKILIDFIGEGDSRLYLMELIYSLKLDSSIKLLGERTRDYIYKNLCNYDVLLQPSRTEGFGLSIIEAGFANVPIVASDIEGLAEIIDKEKYGYLFEVNNLDEYVNKILKAIEQNDNYKQLYKYNYFCENFTIEKTVLSYLKMYKVLK